MLIINVLQLPAVASIQRAQQTHGKYRVFSFPGRRAFAEKREEATYDNTRSRRKTEKKQRLEQNNLRDDADFHERGIWSSPHRRVRKGRALSDYDDKEYRDPKLRQEEGAFEEGNMLQHPLLQIPCHFSLLSPAASSASASISMSSSSSRINKKRGNIPIRTFCDTGASRTVMSWEAAKRLGLLQHLDRRYAGGHATGVGSCQILGRIPAGLARLHLHDVVINSPAITVLEQTGAVGVELLLGLDFLREQKAIVNLREECLQLQLRPNQPDICIPFIQPGSSAASIEAGGSAFRSDERSNQRHCDIFEGDDDEWDNEWEDCEDIESIDMSGV